MYKKIFFSLLSLLMIAGAWYMSEKSNILDLQSAAINTEDGLDITAPVDARNCTPELFAQREAIYNQIVERTQTIFKSMELSTCESQGYKNFAGKSPLEIASCARKTLLRKLHLAFIAGQNQCQRSLEDTSKAPVLEQVHIVLDDGKKILIGGGSTSSLGGLTANLNPLTNTTYPHTTQEKLTIETKWSGVDFAKQALVVCEIPAFGGQPQLIKPFTCTAHNSPIFSVNNQGGLIFGFLLFHSLQDAQEYAQHRRGLSTAKAPQFFESNKLIRYFTYLNNRSYNTGNFIAARMEPPLVKEAEIPPSTNYPIQSLNLNFFGRSRDIKNEWNADTGYRNLSFHEKQPIQYDMNSTIDFSIGISPDFFTYYRFVAVTKGTPQLPSACPVVTVGDSANFSLKPSQSGSQFTMLYVMEKNAANAFAQKNATCYENPVEYNKILGNNNPLSLVKNMTLAEREGWKFFADATSVSVGKREVYSKTLGLYYLLKTSQEISLPKLTYTVKSVPVDGIYKRVSMTISDKTRALPADTIISYDLTNGDGSAINSPMQGQFPLSQGTIELDIPGDIIPRTYFMKFRSSVPAEFVSSDNISQGHVIVNMPHYELKSPVPALHARVNIATLPNDFYKNCITRAGFINYPGVCEKNNLRMIPYVALKVGPVNTMKIFGGDYTIIHDNSWYRIYTVSENGVKKLLYESRRLEYTVVQIPFNKGIYNEYQPFLQDEKIIPEKWYDVNLIPGKYKYTVEFGSTAANRSIPGGQYAAGLLANDRDAKRGVMINIPPGVYLRWTIPDLTMTDDSKLETEWFEIQ